MRQRLLIHNNIRQLHVVSDIHISIFVHVALFVIASFNINITLKGELLLGNIRGEKSILNGNNFYNEMRGSWILWNIIKLIINILYRRIIFHALCCTSKRNVSIIVANYRCCALDQLGALQLISTAKV